MHPQTVNKNNCKLHKCDSSLAYMITVHLQSASAIFQNIALLAVRWGEVNISHLLVVKVMWNLKWLSTLFSAFCALKMPGGYTAFSVKHYKISAKYYTNKNCSENTTKLLFLTIPKMFTLSEETMNHLWNTTLYLWKPLRLVFRHMGNLSNTFLVMLFLFWSTVNLCVSRTLFFQWLTNNKWV